MKSLGKAWRIACGLGHSSPSHVRDTLRIPHLSRLPDVGTSPSSVVPSLSDGTLRKQALRTIDSQYACSDRAGIMRSEFKS